MKDDEAKPVAEGEADLALRLADMARRWWRPHFRGYVALNIALSVINWLVSDYWWGFWPFFATSILAALHFFLVKSLDPDKRWIEERGNWILSKSYDIDHVRRIEESYRTGTMPGRHDLNHGDGEKKPDA